MATGLGQLAEEAGLSARAGADLVVGGQGGVAGAAVHLVITAEAVIVAVTVPVWGDAVPVPAHEVRVLAVAHNFVLSAMAVLELVAEIDFGNADVFLAVEAGAALRAARLVITGRAVIETVAAEFVVDAATAFAFEIPFVAARGACSRAVGLVFAARTVVVRVADPVFRDADVGPYAVNISLTALGAVNFILAAHAVGFSIAHVAVRDAGSVVAFEGSGQTPQLLRGHNSQQQQGNSEFTDH
ncbi:hypothetical protein QHH03_27855, partial [Aphanizomenon sp. 202]|nr:hypothetical protein [Aphanizomenon sp. 202]